ncbi:MAG: F0F1 ATP synthase subunit gamma [Holosporales bacterium]
MPSLKELRNRKRSVQATRKITSAMKMIAAAKLRRAQEQAQAGRPYADMIEDMIRDLSQKQVTPVGMPTLLVGNGRSNIHLIVVATSNRGLCGSFNSSIVRYARRLMLQEQGNGREIKIICLGRRGRDQLRREFGPSILETVDALDKPRFRDAAALSQKLQDLYAAGQFDLCTVVYNRFLSALNQEVTAHRLIPFTPLPRAGQPEGVPQVDGLQAVYDYEPDETTVLAQLLPRNLNVQLYRAMLENAASEQGARMTAMEGATRNAEDMIRRLDLQYNRSRQAYITNELIEIISGAEAL